ncbi:polysialyltransferase family glycosyltransferase [Pseudomonas sp. RW10S2]|uniref:polysialyltransferase family glycosyltransferase n=1 Tax=Pseudomonas sp. RW10S2 TaxID=459637 RepID=UPI001648544B|nr:polysialyltransferase family glycosyltransferase [Pseudomonas sp. RW10S2]MBC3465570.1 hypothetical protein [Pseudomonas sp. RW10S2]QXI44668.1 alpha-2,8-polysialyltransferase family protein [Pseudomonas wayambapalatensis]
MIRIVVCQTPLHFFLCLTLLPPSDAQTILVFVEESDVNERLVTAIQALHRASLIRLPGNRNHSSKHARFLQKYRNVRQLKRDPRIAGADELLIFNDTTPEGQYLMDVVARRNGRIALGEDGVATYALGGVIPSGRLNRWLGKLLFGLWWAPGERIGTSARIGHVHASFPHRLRNDVAVGRTLTSLVPIVRDDLPDALQDLAFEFAQGASLCLVPLIASVGIEHARRFVMAMNADGVPLVIKFHPRESEENMGHLLSAVDAVNASIAPSSMPAEMLYALTENCPTVIGFRSSALHIIAALYPRARVRYYEFSARDEGGQWLSFYDSLGLTAWRSATEGSHLPGVVPR